ncbi:MAG: hypothetical protein JSU96_06265 [Acidobacteriota bacterium]|nr:MAG: hypothetical protein JSU96_06265 [Acidobacteriota bacterium]
MAKKITVVIRSADRQYEGLRYSLGLMFECHAVCMVVLDHEVESTEEYSENAEFIEELGGRRLSNVEANILHHGFGHVSFQELTEQMTSSDLVVPF